MMQKAVVAVCLMALLALASAQNPPNADDARQLGEPGSNYCEALCKEAVKRNSNYAKLEGFCVTECGKCVDAVAKTKQGAKEALPAPCKTAYNFKEVSQIISEFQSGSLKAEKKGRRLLRTSF